MTLIKTNYGDEEDEENSQKMRKRPKQFDARHILEKYSDFEFGSLQPNEIQLAICKSKGADGFYKCTTVIQF